jgi:glutamate synthase domain-containing protein 2
LLTIVGITDLLQTKRALRRNYPILAHFRYLLRIDPPRDPPVLSGRRHGRHAVLAQSAQHRLSARQAGPDKRPFGTQMDVYARLRMDQPFDRPGPKSARTTSASRSATTRTARAQPYSASVFNISAMSFGALSANAILALESAAPTRRLHARYRRRQHQPSTTATTNGGDLVWEIGSGYFGCRNADGSFSEKLHRQRHAAAGEDDRR